LDGRLPTTLLAAATPDAAKLTVVALVVEDGTVEDGGSAVPLVKELEVSVLEGVPLLSSTLTLTSFVHLSMWPRSRALLFGGLGIEIRLSQ